jgi:hypothetical protein
MADEDVIFYNPIWFLILSTKWKQKQMTVCALETEEVLPIEKKSICYKHFFQYYISKKSKLYEYKGNAKNAIIFLMNHDELDYHLIIH